MDVQQLFTNLSKEAECPLCLETVNNPKTLPCLHSFCVECLDKHAGFARRQLQATIKCPVCQTSFQIPEGDSFKNLPTSYHLNRLVDVLALKDGGTQAQKCGSCEENNTASSYCFVCQNFFCTACSEAHQRLKTTRAHRNVLIKKLQAQYVQELIHRPVMCSQQYHENQPLEFYCEECKVPICHKCSVVSHNRHTMTDTQKAAQVQKMQMKDALEKVEAKIAVCEMEVRKKNEMIQKSRKEAMSAEKKMKGTVNECICELQQHERTMNDKFAEIYEAQQKHQLTQLGNFELFLTQLKSCVERGESIIERNISAEIVQTNQAIIRRCENLLNGKKPEIYRPFHVYYVVDRKANVFDRILSLISVSDPSISSLEVESQKDVTEKTETNFSIVTRTSDGKQCYQGHVGLEVKIFTPADDQLKTEIKDTKDGKYTVTYTPQCVGQHRVEIQVNGQPLTGSPWFVQVIPHQYQFSFQFGSKGKEQGEFGHPSLIAVSDKTGRIAVTDTENDRIQIFDFEGRFLGVKLPASFVFTGSEGDFIYSVVEDNERIFLCTENGQHIRSIDRKQLNQPTCVVLENDGRLIICDLKGKKVKVLTPDGKHELLSFSAPGCDVGPVYAVHHRDKFFVSYPDANRVMAFNNRGEYVHDIGCEGSGDGQLMFPSGLVVDKFDHLIVCDTGNRRLQLFTLDGKFITRITESFFENGVLASCAVSNNGHLFVSDIDKNCVYVFNCSCL